MARTMARRSPPPSLPPPRRIDPLAADRAAPEAHRRPPTPTARVYSEGARRRQRMAGQHVTGQGGGERRSGPPSPPPPRSPPGLRAAGAPTLRPPEPTGRPPCPRRNRGAGEGTQLDPHAARPSAPSRLLPRGSRLTGEPAPACQGGARTTPGGGMRRRTRAVWGPRPPWPEHCRRHPQRAWVRRGPWASVSRAAPPPLLPPGRPHPTHGAASRPRRIVHARGGCADDERGGRVGNHGPPPRGRAGRPRCDPPETEGMIPPPPGETAAPERGAGARPAPPPQPPAPSGTTRNKRTRTNGPGRRTGRAQRRQARPERRQ